VLALTYLNEAKKSDYLLDVIQSVVTKYDINEKLFGFVSDSGRDIRAAIKSYPNLTFRLPCANHKLNLCVNDLFKIIDIKSEKNDKNQLYIMSFNCEGELSKKTINSTEKKQIEIINVVKEKINSLIEKCRHLVGSFRHSEVLKRKLKQKQIDLRYENKVALVQDISTRWNTTYDLLDSISCNLRALKALKLENDCSIIQSYVPSDKEFDLIDELCNLLLPLKELTNLFAGQTYCTISLLMPAIHSFTFKELPQMKFEFEEIELLRDILVESLQARFAYLFNDDLIKSCTMLDFRFKNFEFLSDKNLREEYKMKAKTSFLKFADEYLKPTDSQKILNSDKDVKNKKGLKDLTNTQQQTVQTTQITSGQSDKIINKKRQINKHIIENLKDKPITTSEDLNQSSLEIEIDKYLNHNLVINNAVEESVNEYGSIYFFKENYKLYPLLTRIAKSFLSLPATSVPCETLFSQWRSYM
jgi:hypothetical protein